MFRPEHFRMEKLDSVHTRPAYWSDLGIIVNLLYYWTVIWIGLALQWYGPLSDSGTRKGTFETFQMAHRNFWGMSFS